MAAYAALLSLLHTLHQIHNHPRPPISLQITHLQSLTHKITFLQEFLEGYSPVGSPELADDLEMRIAEAAYAAEDAIESHIADQIHAESASHEGTIKCFNCLRKSRSQDKKISSHTDPIDAGCSSQDEAISSVDLYEGLQKGIQDMDLIMREAMEKMREQDLMHRKSTPATAVRSPGETFMVGFDDLLNEVMDKLTDGQSGRQIIPIVGMGGSGKTTLAKNVYQNQVVVQRFDILVWVTISQECRVGEILSELLSQFAREHEISHRYECELGERLHKMLSGRRYLIVLDDIWDIQAWDQLRIFFPDNNNGSRIILTTRLSNMGYQVADTNVIKMGLLDEDNSWDLFTKLVFGEEGCPFGLEEIGKKIVKRCKGLPLSIVVVGGLLAKTEYRQEYWERIGGNLSSAVNSEDDESCLKILRLSYTQLPVYLKPCFLYMGVFEEDNEIRVSNLVKLWVAEGFLKPIRGKSMEIVAKEYLKDLIDRNLVTVHKLGSTGSIKYCKIHDLLRDLCLREAQKERLYNVMEQQSRRIVVLDSSISKKNVNTCSLVRSLIWNSDEKVPSLDFRLLRIMKTNERYPIQGSEYLWEDMDKFYNLRYIAIKAHWNFQFASSVHLLWNLQTLILHSRTNIVAPSEIWNMPQLKQIKCGGGLLLPDPSSRQATTVLVNLQKLITVIDFKCQEETVRRIPNVRKLKLRYELFKVDSSDYCLNNLERLHKLESLYCAFMYGRPIDSVQSLSFPLSLKKLTLDLPYFKYWEDVMEKIGSLLFLQKLRLKGGFFHGQKWETFEGQFRSLKFLEINCPGLKYWATDYSHFPRLEHLVLKNMWHLEEIPSEIGEILSLQTIEVQCCSDGVVISGREILREQQEVGNEGLQVKVRLYQRNDLLWRLKSSPNFQVET